MKLNIIFLITLISISALAAPTLFKEGSINLQAVSIGDSAAADAKSLLDIKSTTKGVLFPRMTSTQMNAISSPPTGLMVWNTTAGTLYQYTGSSWAPLDGYPSQTGNSGKFLTTNGTTTSWATVDALPSQAGNSGKYLTTNGTAASWATVDALPSQTGNSDKVLTTDGTSASWIKSEGVTNYILNPNARFNTNGWATYKDAAGVTPVDGTGGTPTVTYLRTTSDPLNVETGTSFNFNHGASNQQGEGFSYDFTISAADVGKVMTVTFDYTKYFGTYASDDIQFFIYDKTSGALVASQDLPYKLKNHGLVSLPARFQFISTDNTLNRQYRLIGHVTSTATTAYTLMFANFKVSRDPGPVQIAQAYFFGGMEQAGATGCVYSENTSTSITNFVSLGTGTGCNAWTTSGSVTATGTNDHRPVINNGGAGTYVVKYIGNIANSTASQACAFRLSDGTNTYQPQATRSGTTSLITNTLEWSLEYTTSPGTKTLTIQAADDGAGACALNNVDIGAAWKIYYFPTPSMVVPNPTQYEFNETDCASAPGVGAVTVSMTTNTTTTCKVYRRKNRAYYDILLSFNGAPNGSDLVATLQTVIDTAKNAGGASGAGKVYGQANVYDLSTRVYTGNVVGSSSTSVFGTHSESGNIGIINATNPATLGSGDSINLKFDVPVVGWVENPIPVTAYDPLSNAWRVDANITGAAISLGTSAVSSYTGIENGSLTLTNNSGPTVIPAQIPCSGTNAPSGTTCSSGNESLGVSFNLPRPGEVLACASFSWFGKTPAASSLEADFQVVETPNNAQTILQEGGSRMSGAVGASLDLQFPFRTCGTLKFSSAGQKTVRLMYEQSFGGTITNSLVLADAAPASGQRDVHWEVYPISSIGSAPVLVPGQMSTNSSVPTKYFSGVVNSTCSSSPCTLDSGATPGLSITRSGTGLYVANVSSGCSTNLACSISQSTFSHQRNGSSTTSTYPFVLVASGGSSTDGSMSVMCTCQ